MRADRLLSLLIFLQTNGKTSARALAEELEVSERTIYRDLEALSMSGVPVFAERGPGGGISLLESYRTNLTGLTHDEVRALSMLNIPAPLAQLGFGQELKAALLKLSAALPEASRREQVLAQERIHLDASWWFQSALEVPQLQHVQQALWEDHKLHLVYRTSFGARVEQTLAPYGLVAKASIWYLVAQRDDIPGLRVYPLADIVSAEVLAEAFVRPDDFSLAVFWSAYCKALEVNRPVYWVSARISTALAGELGQYFGDTARDILTQSGPADAQGWRLVRLPFERFETARERLLGFGRAAEVIEPDALRKSLIDFSRQILNFYTGLSETITLDPNSG
jgi:predicted DNA-binding transcriptional regulator YafY